MSNPLFREADLVQKEIDVERAHKSRLNRINFRWKIGNWTIFWMIAKTQKLTGLTSRISFNNHIVLWDLDECNLEQAKKNAKENTEKIQFK